MHAGNLPIDWSGHTFSFDPPPTLLQGPASWELLYQTARRLPPFPSSPGRVCVCEERFRLCTAPVTHSTAAGCGGGAATTRHVAATHPSRPDSEPFARTVSVSYVPPSHRLFGGGIPRASKLRAARCRLGTPSDACADAYARASPSSHPPFGTRLRRARARSTSRCVRNQHPSRARSTGLVASVDEAKVNF